MEKTLTREANKLQEAAIPSAEPGRDVDRYWLRPFYAKESVERIKQFEQRKLEAQVWCGFELWRAKFSLPHGELEPHYFRACLSPSTASRRRGKAIQFMQWADILRGNQPEEQHIVQAMDLAHSKPFILKDFKNYLDKVTEPQRMNEFLDKGYYPPGTKQHILGVSLKELRQLLDRIEQAILNDYPNWSAIERDEVKQTLQLVADEPLRLKRDIEKLGQRSPKEQIRGMVHNYHKHRFEKSDKGDRKERIIQWLRGKENEQNSEVTERLIANLE